jgi:hypothetical protein
MTSAAIQKHHGEPPRLFGIEPPRPKVEATRTVDMSGSNAWAEFASLYRQTRTAALDNERAKTELKALVNARRIHIKWRSRAV